MDTYILVFSGKKFFYILGSIKVDFLGNKAKLETYSLQLFWKFAAVLWFLQLYYGFLMAFWADMILP